VLWAYSYDGETYCGGYETKEIVIAEGLKHQETDYPAYFYYGSYPVRKAGDYFTHSSVCGIADCEDFEANGDIT